MQSYKETIVAHLPFTSFSLILCDIMQRNETLSGQLHLYCHALRNTDT